MPVLSPEERRCRMMAHLHPGPGPAAYDIKSTFGKCNICGVPNKSSSPAWTIRGRGCLRETEYCGPSPGDYNLPSSIGACGCTPGVKRASPRQTFGIKHSEFAHVDTGIGYRGNICCDREC